MDFILNEKRSYGYTDNKGGYSGTFSWTRTWTKNPALFLVIGHIDGFTDLISYGVTDDFGNIVKVQS